jgi:hypothetical protein
MAAHEAQGSRFEIELPQLPGQRVLALVHLPPRWHETTKSWAAKDMRERFFSQ